MRRMQLASALAAAIGLRPTVQAAQEPAGGAATAVPPRLALARELLASLEPARTGYRHRSQVRFADGARPSLAWTDCSGLLNALLARADPQVMAALVAASPDGRPQAIDYVAAIERADGFLRITGIDAIVPGDIVAIAFDPATEQVATVNSYSLKDGKIIAFNDRETPTRGREMTILEQLLGNVGRGGMLPRDEEERIPGNRPGDR